MNNEPVAVFPNISWQRVAEVDILWQKKPDGMFPSSHLTIQEVTMKHVCFLILEALLIRRIWSSRLSRQRAL